MSASASHISFGGKNICTKSCLSYTKFNLSADLGNLFIHACLLESDFVERELTGCTYEWANSSEHCAASTWVSCHLTIITKSNWASVKVTCACALVLFIHLEIFHAIIAFIIIIASGGKFWSIDEQIYSHWMRIKRADKLMSIRKKHLNCKVSHKESHL